MNKLGLLAGAALAGLALPQDAIAQDRPADGIGGGRPLQIEREPNTLAPPPVAVAPSLAAPETRAARKAARSRIYVRPRVRTARRRPE